MFKINDHMEGAIYLNGQELELSGANFMQSLHIRSSARAKLPVAVLRFTDLTNSAMNNGLQDSVPMVVAINGVLNKEYKFRVHRWSRTPAGDAFNYAIEAYLDSPKWWAGTAGASINGTSYEAIQKMANECGLKMWQSSTPTSDTMIWNPGNRVYSEFARLVCRAGFIDDQSHMALAVDFEGQVRYVNVNALAPPTLNLGHVAEGTGGGTFVQILDFTPTATAGDNNMLAGYLHDRYVQTLEKPEILKEVTLSPDSKKPLLNKDVREAIARGGISYGPLDFGNAHPKYERALYQNLRFNMLNNLQAEVSIGFQTDLDIFNNFKYVPPQELESVAYSGEFTISDKIIYIAGPSYYEKLIVTKNGLEA